MVLRVKIWLQFRSSNTHTKCLLEAVKQFAMQMQVLKKKVGSSSNTELRASGEW